MKLLKDILIGVSIEQTYGLLDKQISSIVYDSRKAKNQSLFVAVSGENFDGHNYIDKVIAKGSTVILVEKEISVKNLEATFIRVKDSRKALAIIASNYYDNPSKHIKLIGITGTNGKTTIATLCFDLFEKMGFVTGLLSTIAIKYGKQVIPAKHTTPDSLTINSNLRAMVDLGVKYCFMEVSSHGINQRRIYGLSFTGGVFTNLTHDHLDYHKTFHAYRDTKKVFFDTLPKTAFALTNLDDKNGAIMLQNTKAKKVSYAIENFADYRAQVLEYQQKAMLLRIDTHELWTQLIGSFNASNILAVYSIALLLGQNSIEVLTKISKLQNVSGRFQTLQGPNDSLIIVDYAHTPDALEKVLSTINSIRTSNAKLTTIVGCGGDRDKNKRPKMGAVASSMSDRVIFTSDNPRFENVEHIIDQMEAGVDPKDYKKIMRISNRREAIKTACILLSDDDVLLISGKGHEIYQEEKGVKTEFDDYKVVSEIVSKLS